MRSPVWQMVGASCAFMSGQKHYKAALEQPLLPVFTNNTSNNSHKLKRRPQPKNKVLFEIFESLRFFKAKDKERVFYKT